MNGVLRYDAKEISAGDLVSCAVVRCKSMEFSKLVRCADKMSGFPTKGRRLHKSAPSFPISPTSAEDREESKLNVVVVVVALKSVVELRLLIMLLMLLLLPPLLLLLLLLMLTPPAAALLASETICRLLLELDSSSSLISSSKFSSTPKARDAHNPIYNKNGLLHRLLEQLQLLLLL
jgi:hypothetical protein